MFANRKMNQTKPLTFKEVKVKVAKGYQPQFRGTVRGVDWLLS